MKKEILLNPEELKQFQNHSSQMAALDYLVSIASDVFIPTFDGNMAKVVEGHRRYHHQNSRNDFFFHVINKLSVCVKMTQCAYDVYSDILGLRRALYLTEENLWNFLIHTQIKQFLGMSLSVPSN